ncbi:xanthine dehydrogenase accessory protein XdhC [Paraglaciecola aquimarina]|uniref:Xanthine dehydrogenase accessory protein XdhC n=1 Tax=Paraglaciecola algarum TaxID=3050085 RepID=A0ABS9D758_9ALTE|nr:xanthine dehydrogenase accessory protein XdhC [Paraglaciecola sp. G1-23]MCF2948711.1 xanthine dehydrogenase accessory protein XdhC [Paraglaciecola sp. G1-23]
MQKLTWTQAIERCNQTAKAYVIATVIGAQGSTPRDTSSKMVIDAQQSYDTIGGGQLEYLIIQEARKLMLKNETCQVFRPLPLAAEAAQCCGGFVTVLLECFAASERQIVLFGAGHVSQALIQILSGLPCQVTLVDNRPEQIPAELPANCQSVCIDSPQEIIATLPDNSSIVVFTHDHQLDYSLIKTMLDKPRFSYVGLIGSDTKAKRFKKRLASEHIQPEVIDSLYCPIGLPELKGKLPMEVALSIAAQLQSLFYQEQAKSTGANHKKRKGTSWREIKQAISLSDGTPANVYIDE